jgi:hypothetical protein
MGRCTDEAVQRREGATEVLGAAIEGFMGVTKVVIKTTEVTLTSSSIFLKTDVY